MEDHARTLLIGVFLEMKDPTHVEPDEPQIVAFAAADGCLLA